MRYIRKCCVDFLDLATLADQGYMAFQRYLEVGLDKDLGDARKNYVRLMKLFRELDKDKKGEIKRDHILEKLLDEWRIQGVIGLGALSDPNIRRQFCFENDEYGEDELEDFIYMIEDEKNLRYYADLSIRAAELGNNGMLETVFCALDYVRDVYPKVSKDTSNPLEMEEY